MPLLVWFSVENNSLLLSAEKPQVPATVSTIKRKLPGALQSSPWQSISSGGADVDYSALKFSSKNAVNPSFTLNFGTLWHNVTRLPASIFGGISGENHRLRGKNGEF